MALKVGVVGMRGIGNNHANCHSQDPLAELVAVCDKVKERADQAAARLNVKAYYSLTDMLRNEDLDVVDVTTGGFENGSWHFEPAMEAIEAGKAVLVEKPLSNDIHEARQMVAAAAKKGVYLGCNLNHYFTETAQKGEEYIREGKIGEIVYCLHKMGFNGGEESYKPNKSSRWWGFPYAHLKAFLTHPFSVMRHFCGDITHVQAFVDRPSFRRRAGDAMLSIASVNVRFANGAVGYLLSQRGDSMFGLGGWWSFELSGTRGAFCIENCIEKITYWEGPNPNRAARPENLSMGAAAGTEVMDTGIKDFGATFPRRIHAFLEDVTNRVPREQIRASGRDALAALEYTWAVIESYEQGGALVRPHPLPPIHGDPVALPD
ncbi:MAG: Gfo/Idh/MocA family oxidoreductase [Armatimonadota bacterium]|nr:Gfo/Idh/MocA family oxidoreductase [Armatimonadota bacterium]